MNGHCAVKQRCAVRNLGLYTATMRGTYLGIVLRVHEAVVVVAVTAALSEAIVGAGGVLHVDIRLDAHTQEERRGQHEPYHCGYQSGERDAAAARPFFFKDSERLIQSAWLLQGAWACCYGRAHRVSSKPFRGEDLNFPTLYSFRCFCRFANSLGVGFYKVRHIFEKVVR